MTDGKRPANKQFEFERIHDIEIVVADMFNVDYVAVGEILVV